MILLAPVSRVALAAMGVDLFEAGPGVLLPLKCDGLGFGAALALYAERKDCVTIHDFLSSPYVIGCAGLLTIVGGWFATAMWIQPVTATAFTVLAAAIVNAAIGPPVRMLAWLEWSWLQVIGKMSYGVYVYHFFVPQIWKLTGFALPSDWMSGVVFLLGSLALAKLSWVYMEKPVLRWRDRRWQFAVSTR